MRSRVISVWLGVVVAASAVGCAPSSPTPPAPPQPPAATSTPVPTIPQADTLPADAVLEVTAIATASNGARVALSAVTLKSVAWNDPLGVPRADLMSKVCEGALENSVYDAEFWSFSETTYTATPVEGTATWPNDAVLHLAPFATNLAVAADGNAYPTEDVDIATPFCKRDKFFRAPGVGTVVAGYPGDTDVATAAGNFTKWANYNYGFVSDDTSVMLSDCAYEVTELGLGLNGDEEWWSLKDDASSCFVGAKVEDASG